MATPMPPVDEVRALVAQIVGRLDDGDVAADGGAAAATASQDATVTHLAIGADHGGVALKERLAADLRDRGYTVRDCGTRGSDPVDYPDIAHAVALLVATGECQAGIVIDGAGIGSAIAANKVPGIRAATCWDVSSAKNSREHNFANVLALGAGLVGDNLAREIVQAWLSTARGADRHARRVAKIEQLEQRYGTSLE